MYDSLLWITQNIVFNVCNCANGSIQGIFILPYILQKFVSTEIFGISMRNIISKFSESEWVSIWFFCFFLFALYRLMCGTSMVVVRCFSLLTILIRCEKHRSLQLKCDHWWFFWMVLHKNKLFLLHSHFRIRAVAMFRPVSVLTSKIYWIVWKCFENKTTTGIYNDTHSLKICLVNELLQFSCHYSIAFDFIFFSLLDSVSHYRHIFPLLSCFSAITTLFCTKNFKLYV